MGPSQSQHSQVVLVTISGKDQPGITSSLTGILAQSGATILDIGQAVIHGLLSLSILVELGESDAKDKTTLKDMLFKATELGLKLDFQAIDQKEDSSSPVERREFHYAMTLLGKTISATALHEVTKALSELNLNIDSIQRLSENEFSCVEVLISSDKKFSESKVNELLLGIARKQGIDIALQPEGLFRRAKRLVVLDMDSTLIENEVIDELAKSVDKYDEVAKITEDAMRGEIGFDESFAKRCALLKGLKETDIDAVMKKIRLTPGASDLIRVLKGLGYKVALLSGGFHCIADRLRDDLKIDYVYANHLVFKNGECTGEVQPPIVNAERKADLLDVIAQQERIMLDQVIAVGDGANDLLMLQRAGLGIAFNAKPVLQEKADLSLNQRNLKSILYLLGISGRDLESFLSRSIN